jgi:D-mannonate dehydratase
MTEEQSSKLVDTIIKGLPGRTSVQYSLETFREALTTYDDIDEEVVRKNLRRSSCQIAKRNDYIYFLTIQRERE